MIPSYDGDLFADDALAEPYAHYRTLRDLGPVVHLPVHDVYAVARYADARRVLEDPVAFCSGRGVGLNDFINAGGRGTTLMSDGVQHARQRDVIGRPLTPKAVAELRPAAQRLADDLAERLVGRGRFDAVPDLAEVLPATWVPDLLGWPDDGRDHLVEWASDTFDCLGPLNDRTEAAGPGLMAMTAYAHQVAASTLPEGSMAAGILAAAERGDLEPEQCPMAIIDYLGPSLDTTIAALGNAIWLFATHPEQWAQLRREPDRAKHQRLHPHRHRGGDDRRGRGAGRGSGPGELRVCQPRRTAVGRPRDLRHRPQQRRAHRVRLRRARVRRHGVGPARRGGGARGAGRAGRALRARRATRPQAEQPDPVLRIPTGRRPPRLMVGSSRRGART